MDVQCGAGAGHPSGRLRQPGSQLPQPSAPPAGQPQGEHGKGEQISEAPERYGFLSLPASTSAYFIFVCYKPTRPFSHPPSSPYFDQAVLDELQDAVEMLPLTDTSLHNRLAPYLVDDLLSTTDLPEPLMDELKGEHRTCH